MNILKSSDRIYTLMKNTSHFSSVWKFDISLFFKHLRNMSLHTYQMHMSKRVSHSKRLMFLWIISISFQTLIKVYIVRAIYNGWSFKKNFWIYKNYFLVWVNIPSYHENMVNSIKKFFLMVMFKVTKGSTWYSA